MAKQDETALLNIPGVRKARTGEKRADQFNAATRGPNGFFMARFQEELTKRGMYHPQSGPNGIGVVLYAFATVAKSNPELAAVWNEIAKETDAWSKEQATQD